MNEINEIRRQFENGQWQLFIQKITIDKIRGWNGQTVSFRFPVCAVVGENGSGKSTILRAVACAYTNKPKESTYFPSRLFLKTRWDEASVPRDASIAYEIKRGTDTAKGKWKKTNDWGYTPKGKRPERHVVLQDISRTLPLDAAAGYAKIANSSIEEMRTAVPIAEEYMKAYSDIMGDNYSSGRIQPIARRKIGLYTRSCGEVSQFHQGAGEDTLLDLMLVLQTIPHDSLLVIDEVESALHPKAQRRLMRFLLTLARQKKLQIIVSTHSPYVLDEIPPEGRILVKKLSNGGRDIQYRVSTDYALGQMDDQKHPELYIYVEDKEAKILLHEIIKNDIDASRVDIRYVGDQDVVRTMGRLCKDDKVPGKGIAFLDGDAQSHNCFLLPLGGAPEIVVFQGLKALEWNGLDARFGLGAGDLYAVFDDAITAPDHHEFTKRIGDRLGKSKDYVWSIFVEEWCKQCLATEERARIVGNVRSALPDDSGAS